MSVEVFFSPNGGCEAAIVATIDSAKESVHVLAYTFTSIPITAALIRRCKAGIPVFFIGDRVGMKGPGCMIANLNSGGVRCFIDSAHAIAHNKIIIIDSLKVCGGSFNQTKSAENRNAENVTIIVDPVVAKRFKDNWELHYAHSTSYAIMEMPDDDIIPNILTQE